MKNIINKIISIAVILGLTFQLNAQVTTINPGDDFNTIINAASAGDIIEFNPGTYTGYLDLNNLIFSECEPLIIRSANGLGSVTIQKGNFSGTPLGITTCSYIAIDGIAFEGGLRGGYVNYSEHIIIRNCKIGNSGQEGIHVSGSTKYFDFINSEIHNTGLSNSSYGEGIYVGTGSYANKPFPDNSEYVWIENSHIHHCGNGEAVNIKAETFHVTVRGNIIHDIAPGTPQQYNQAAVTIEPAAPSLANNYRLTEYRNHWIENNHIYNVTGGNAPSNAGSWDNGILSGGMGCYILNNHIENCNHNGLKESSYAHLNLPLWVYNNSYANNTTDYAGSNAVNTIVADPGPNPNVPQYWYPINSAPAKSACKLSSNNSYVIDGVEEQLWSTVISDSINKPVNNLTAPSITDLSGAYKLSWDATSLYAIVNVTDDNLVSDGNTTIHDDGLSVYIDGGDENATSYDANDFNIVFKYGTPNIYVNNTLYTGSEITRAETVTSTGYQIEFKVDWSFIGIVPSTLNTLGLDIHINDDDDGGNRDQKLVWKDVTDQAFNNPCKLGVVSLSNEICYSLLEVCQLSSTIVVDGQEDVVWSSIDSTVLSVAPNGGALPAVSDLSATFKSTWDANSLYLWVEVLDDNLVLDGGGTYIHDDGLSIYIDGGNENTISYDANDFNLGFNYGTPDIYSNYSLHTGSGITKAETLTAGGYIMEIKIDWSYLGVTANALSTIGIDIHLNDDDDGGARDQKIMWTDATDQAFNNPSVLADLLLDSTSCSVFCVPTSSQLNETACDSYSLNSQTYTASGTYMQTLSNAAGCDSVLTLNLIINNSSSSMLTETACMSFDLNGQTYTSSGVYTQTLSNVLGCDSVITLNLTINSSTSSSLTEVSCGDYTLNGQTYTSSGVYTQTLSNVLGCDSVITLNLTINNSTSSTLTEVSCGDYLLNGQTYTSSGIYTQTLINSVGCDSVITLNLQIEAFDLSIQNNSGTLSSAQLSVDYQWFNCDSNAIIVGAINQYYNPAVDGDYSVIINNMHCIDTSECYSYISSSIKEKDVDNILLFPNPTKDYFELSSENRINKVEVYNSVGSMVKEMEVGSKSIQLNIEELSKGVYTVRIYLLDRFFVKQIIKK